MHLFFAVQYLDWPIQNIDITNLLKSHLDQTEASLRILYSTQGYQIIREEYRQVDAAGGASPALTSSVGCIVPVISVLLGLVLVIIGVM